MKKRLLVVGGGAAGFFCAINAGASDPSLEVIIAEKTGKLLSKVKVSGGGRCNVTHASPGIADAVQCYPRGDKFLKKAFHQFFVDDTVKWFAERGVKLKTEDDGRMFPITDSSQTIIDCLMKEVNRYNIDILLNKEVKQIKTSSDDKISVTFANGEEMFVDHLCIACGGFAKPMQFAWLTETGHTFEPPVPSLFTFNIPGDPISKLMGVSIDPVLVKINGTKLVQEGPLLITHWGLSGPAVLKLSAFAARILEVKQYNYDITVNWLPGENEQTLLEKFRGLRNSLAPQKFINRNPFKLPQRFWEYLMQRNGINEDIRWADLPAKQQNIFIKDLCSQQFPVKGKTTFKEEFVTAGGITLSEIDPQTMGSRIFPNLYFAGEILNVDGITGGFNFQNAWTTGWIAAKSISSVVDA